MGPSNSASMVKMASAPVKGGSRSCSIDKSAAISSPIKSTRTDSTWPSFMKAGPSAWSASESRSPGRFADIPGIFRNFISRMANRIGTEISTPPGPTIASCRASVRAIAHSRRRLRSVRNMFRFASPNGWRQCHRKDFGRIHCQIRPRPVRSTGFPDPERFECFPPDSDRRLRPRRPARPASATL